MVSQTLGRKVLLVEKNNDILRILKPCFLDHNIDLTHLRSIESVPHCLRNKYSLLIIDTNLFLERNILLIKNIREHNLFIPIIAIGPNDISHRIKSFQLEINIYHSKPVCCELLKAQIAQLTSFFNRKVIFTLGDIKIDMASKSFFVHNKKILFTYQEFHLLLLLMKAHGHTTSRSCISKYFAGTHEEISYAAIDTLISRIRSKLKGHLKEPLIKTEYKIGYRINKDYLKGYRIEKSTN